MNRTGILKPLTGMTTCSGSSLAEIELTTCA